MNWHLPDSIVELQLTIYIYVPHFYDLGWLLVLSLYKEGFFFYKFLNGCPFDYMAVVVSGKVVRT